MAEWRFVRGWSDGELAARLAALDTLERNFDPSEPKTPDNGWRQHNSETAVAVERAGPPVPDGAFHRARAAISRYEFSDPHIVTAHFDPSTPLVGRRILLELKVLGLHFLAGAMVARVREETTDAESVFGFRYDTLEGHIERGWEWFLLKKSHATGEVRFRIAADWQPGDFPNWWSRVGFGVLGRRYQRRWTRRSHGRLRRVVEAGGLRPEPGEVRTGAGGRLLHEGPERINERRSG